MAPQDQQRWSEIYLRYENLPNHIRRLVVEFYKGHYGPAIVPEDLLEAGIKHALSEIAKQQAAEYEEIMRGDEVWASMSKNSES